MSRPPTARATVLIALLLSVAACGSQAQSGAVGGDAKTAYGTAVCDAILGLAGNRADFSVFLNGESREAAIAALHRVRDRTALAADELEAAAGSWAPGHDVAARLATTQRDLLPILADLDAVATGGDVSRWEPATHAYTVWYDSTSAVVQSVAPSLTSLGINCY